MKEETSGIEIVERAFRHSGVSEYDKLPLWMVIKIILTEITDRFND